AFFQVLLKAQERCSKGFIVLRCQLIPKLEKRLSFRADAFLEWGEDGIRRIRQFAVREEVLAERFVCLLETRFGVLALQMQFADENPIGYMLVDGCDFQSYSINTVW